jgi:aristolochene synthase
MWLFASHFAKHVSPNSYSFKLRSGIQIRLQNALASKYGTTSVNRYPTAQAAPFHLQYGVGPSQLELKSHPLGWEAIQALVEPSFAQHWKFTSEREKKGFFALGFSRAFSQFFPLTLNERVEVTCMMHYLALLIDGEFGVGVNVIYS